MVENNIVQTLASAAGTLSAIIFVVPGLVMVGYWSGFPFWETTAVCAVGGILGVMYSIPLRRALVTGSDLPYPEGVAAAEVLKVGDTAGSAEENKRGLWIIIWGGIASTAIGLLTAIKAMGGTLRGAVAHPVSGSRNHRRRLGLDGLFGVLSRRAHDRCGSYGSGRYLDPAEDHRPHRQRHQGFLGFLYCSRRGPGSSPDGTRHSFQVRGRHHVAVHDSYRVVAVGLLEGFPHRAPHDGLDYALHPLRAADRPVGGFDLWPV